VLWIIQTLTVIQWTHCSIVHSPHIHLILLHIILITLRIAHLASVLIVVLVLWILLNFIHTPKITYLSFIITCIYSTPNIVALYWNWGHCSKFIYHLLYYEKR
jgi:hypothetical protein